jgi:hypothetical protein
LLLPFLPASGFHLLPSPFLLASGFWLLASLLISGFAYVLVRPLPFRPVEGSMTIQAEAEAAAREVAPWIERLARVGYAAKGIVYILIGLLALRGATGGMDGAFLTILRQPFGEVLLYAIALGLVGYALWRVLEGIMDPAGRGTDVKGLTVRGFRISRGVFHLFLAWGVFQIARGSGGGAGSDDGAEAWTARLLEQPFGVWLVVGIGLGIIGYGLGQLFRAWKSKLDRKLRIASLDPGKRKWLIRVSRYGLAARGIVFGIIGAFLVQAGISRNAEEAGSTGAALGAIGSGPFGQWTLAIVAVGLASYGVYQLLKARYRRIDVA